MVEPDLESALAAHLDVAHAAWPGIELASEHFVRHMASVLDDAEGASIERALLSVRAGDLYLACACVRGDSRAVDELERGFITPLDAPLRATGLAEAAVDEVRQRVRVILLVGDGLPALARYGGCAQLRSWIRSVAVRQAARYFRRGPEVPVSADAFEAMPVVAGELAPWKQQYAAEFRLAFTQAIAALEERDRNLLRQHHFDGLTVDALAALYQIHRSTAARRVAAARAALLAGVRERLLQRLVVSEASLDSILRLVRSQLDVSFHELLS